MRVTFFGLLLLSAGVAASCSSTKHTSVTDPLATELGFCTQWAAAACNSKVVTACGGSADSCNSRQSTYCQGLLPSNYNSKNAKTCIIAVKNAYADAKITADELKVVRDLGAPCNQLVEGPKQAGDTCGADDECDSIIGLFCVIKAGQTEGTCQVPQVVGGGLDCSAPAAQCATGFYCNGQNCIVRVAEGGTCDLDHPCLETSQCLGATGSMTCAAKAPVGGTCTKNEDCASTICAVGTNRCIDSVTLTPDSPLCKDLG